MRRRATFLALLALAFFSFSLLSHGAGFLIYEHGAVAMAMGGAFVGLANDATAIFHNPAGIAFLEGTQLSAGTTLIFPRSSVTLPSIQLVDPAYATTYKQKNQVFYPSTFYITHKFSDMVVAGFGFFSPYGLGAEWPEDYPLKYISIKDDMKTFIFNPTIAFKLNDNLALAFGASYIYSTVAFDLVYQFDPGFPFEEFDVPASIEKASGSAWGFNAGALYRGEQFSFGFNWRSAFTIDYEGDLSLDMSGAPIPGLPEEGTAGLPSFKFPHILGIGAAFNLTEQLTLTADVHYILWSSYEELTVELDVLGLPIDFEPIPENWEDSFVFRGGLQYMVNENFALRAGFLYDQTPQPVETMDPILPDADRWAITGGFGFRSGQFAIDVAYQYEPFKDRTSPNRDIYDIPFVGNLGEGTYSTTAHLIGVSIGYIF